MSTADFERMLTGGHPNSLGKTVAVVDAVLADRSRLDELYQCYFSDDEVVRLRVSSAMKRICQAHADWLVPYIDAFQDEISTIDQASAQWTLAQLFLWLNDDMTETQKHKAVEILKRNLMTNDDWIVQNHTMETLGTWAGTDEDLRAWLVPQLERLVEDHRKSVAGRARKLLNRLAR